MKKFLIISLLSLICSVNLHAQEPGHWTGNVSAAYVGNLEWTKAGADVGMAFAEIITTIFTLGLFTPKMEYANTVNHDCPAFALQGGYQVNDWLQITGDAYYHWFGYDQYKEREDKVPTRITRVNRVALLPGVKFTYLNKGLFHMYSSIALGAGFNFGYHDEYDVKEPFNGLRFTLQTVPVGIAIGGRNYGFLDLGVGTEYFCFRAGYGYNF